MEQISLWKESLNQKKSLAMKLRESKAIYNIQNGDDTSMELIFAALLGNIPDETMTSFLAIGLTDLLKMTKEEFLQYPGIGPGAAARLMAAITLTRKLCKTGPMEHTKINSPDDVFELMKDEMKLYDREHFIVLLLDTKMQVIAKEIISIGTLNASMVHPRELFNRAIRRSAASMILLHNHPSGDPSPSREDIEVTKRMVEAGKIIGIEVQDHIVLGFEKFISLKSQGII